MPINIERMDSTVRAVDGSTLISPQVMQQIIEMVLRAVEQDSAHQRRVQAVARQQHTVGGRERHRQLDRFPST